MVTFGDKKVIGSTLDIVPLCELLRSAQVWHVFSRDLAVLPAHTHVHPQSE